MSGFDIDGLGLPLPDFVGDALRGSPGRIGGERQPGRPVETPTGSSIGSSSATGNPFAAALNEIAALDRDASSKAAALARGEPVELHELMIAMGKTDVAFSLMLEVRNKLIDAWQTLSRSVM